MSHDTHPPLVLLIDDTPEIRELYADTLRAAGFRVELAEDGAEGVKKALALVPAVILMDLRMPRLDGLAAVRRLRQNPRTHAIPVILSTSEPVEQQAQEAGCAFLPKPCSLDALVAAVQAQLER